MIPLAFHKRALELGYGDGAGWDALEAEWAEWERYVSQFAAEHGFTVWMDGPRVWGSRDGEGYLLASAAEPEDDPMNLWSHAFSRIDCRLRKDDPFAHEYFAKNLPPPRSDTMLAFLFMLAFPVLAEWAELREKLREQVPRAQHRKAIIDQ